MVFLSRILGKTATFLCYGPVDVVLGWSLPIRCCRRSSSATSSGRLTGRETESWEHLYFKLYKSQLAVIKRALKTAALMLGPDNSRG
jgi:hypothetical protein